MRHVVIPSKGKAKIHSKGAFNYYQKNARHRNKENTYRLYQYSRIVRNFYTKIGEAMIENEGGVFIKNLGYFTVLKHPKKTAIRMPYAGGKTFFNPNTDNHRYMPTFINVAKYKPLLNFWVMDRTFSRAKIKSRLHKALKAGKKYKTYISTLSSLYLLKDKRK